MPEAAEEQLMKELAIDAKSGLSDDYIVEMTPLFVGLQACRPPNGQSGIPAEKFLERLTARITENQGEYFRSYEERYANSPEYWQFDAANNRHRLNELAREANELLNEIVSAEYMDDNEKITALQTQVGPLCEKMEKLISHSEVISKILRKIPLSNEPKRKEQAR